MVPVYTNPLLVKLHNKRRVKFALSVDPLNKLLHMLTVECALPEAARLKQFGARGD
jgi:hypothetical protein